MHYDPFERHELLAKVIHDSFLLVHTPTRIRNNQIFIKLDGLLAQVFHRFHRIQLLAHGRGAHSDDPTLFGQRVDLSIGTDHERHVICFVSQIIFGNKDKPRFTKAIVPSKGFDVRLQQLLDLLVAFAWGRVHANNDDFVIFDDERDEGHVAAASTVWIATNEYERRFFRQRVSTGVVKNIDVLGFEDGLHIFGHESHGFAVYSC